MNTKVMLGDISTYRTPLMGVAILFIMAYHSIGHFSFGDIGVEWFLILSAVGICFSLSKSQSVISFYKKRIIRILPAYFIVAVPYFIIKTGFGDINHLLLQISGLTLFIYGKRYFWFITLILICYLIAPAYYSILKYRVSIIIPFAAALLAVWLSPKIPNSEILVSRVPVFLIGMNFGRRILDAKREKDEYVAFSTIVSFFMLFAVIGSQYLFHLPIRFQRLLYFICAIPSLISMVFIVKNISIVRKCCAFIGPITLEIYLLHERIVLPLCQMLPLPCLIIVLFSYVVAVVLSFILHYSIDFVMKRTTLSRYNPNAR